MGFLRQTTAQIVKNLTILAWRSFFSTSIRAFLAPIIYIWFLSYSKNFFIPPADYGIGTAVPVRSLPDALGASKGGRDKVIFVDNGHTGGDIAQVISNLSSTVTGAGKTAITVGQSDDLLIECRSSLRGASPCFAAIDFRSSPSEGPGGVWNYTIRADSALSSDIYVSKHDNDAEIYLLPIQKAVDSIIIQIGGGDALPETNEYPYTTLTDQGRDDRIRRLFADSIINILAPAFFLVIVGVTYQLTGFMATERELGLSQLIEAMTPNRKQWYTQVSRLLALHLSFDALYLPAWIISGLIMAGIVYGSTSAAIPTVFNILAGFSLTSFSILGASLFRKAQLSGISVTIVSVVLAILAQVTGPTSTAGVAIVSLLFPPINYVYFIIYMSRFEKRKLPANLLKSPPDSSWQLPGIVFWIFLILQAMIFPVMGAFVERKLYGTASRTRKMLLKSPDSSTAIKLTNMSKYYPPNFWRSKIVSLFKGKPRETVRAVNDLSFEAIRGQIMVLLGANGSGKSTTLDAIAGINSVTSGDIEVDGTGGLGLCPQKNVLWDQLTVFEHVSIFNHLKTSGKPDSKAEIQALIAACDLQSKMKAKAKTLSGGQKRKLQLAMMFTGGSRVCCIDEVSSGLDPLSRRKIWDILLAERGKRTLLLTTHFLDEADILSDKILILSQGNLKAEGSAVGLKHTYGGGYRLHIYKSTSGDVPAEFSDLPREEVYDQTVYQLADSAQAARYVRALEDAGIRDYQINGPTVEDVFLKLAEEVREHERQHLGHDEDGLKDQPLQSAASGAFGRSTTRESESFGTQLLSGQGTGFAKQTWILFRKRLTILKRNYLPYAAATLIPIAAAGLTTLFLKDFDGLSCSLKKSSDNPDAYSLRSFSEFENIVAGPPDRIPYNRLQTQFDLRRNSFQNVSTLDEFNAFISQNFHTTRPGGIFLGIGGDSPVLAYIGNFNLYTAVMTQNLMDSALGDVDIQTSLQSFAVNFSESAGKSLQLVLYFGLAMAVYPAFFALYPTRERLGKVRALHYSNGVRSAPLWVAYLLFDFCFVAAISTLTVVIFAATWSHWFGLGYVFLIFLLYGLASIAQSYVITLFVTSQLAAFAIAAGGQAIFLILYFVIYFTILTYVPAASVDSTLSLASFLYSIITPAGSLARALYLTLNEFSVACQGQQFAKYPGGIKYFGGPIVYLIVQALVLFAVLLAVENRWIPSFLRRKRAVSHDAEDESEGKDDILRAEETRVQDANPGLRVLNLTKRFKKNTVVQDVSFGVRHDEVFALLGPNGAGKSTTIGLIRGDIRPTGHNSSIFVEDIPILQQRALARSHLGVCPQFDAMDQLTVTEHLHFYASARGVPSASHNVSAVLSAVGLTPYATRLASKLSGGNKRKLSLAIAIMGNPSVLLLDEPSSGMDAAAKRVIWRTLASVSRGRSLVITTHSMEEADALATRAGIIAGKMLALGTVDELRRRHGDAYHVHLVHGDAPHTSQEDMARLKEWVEENVRGAIVESAGWLGQMRFTVPNRPSLVADDSPPHREEERAPSDEKIATERSSSGNDIQQSSHPSAPADTRSESGGVGNGSIASLFTLLENHKSQLNIEYYSVSQTTLDQIFLTIVRRHNVLEEGHDKVDDGSTTKRKEDMGVWERVKYGWFRKEGT